MNEKIFLIWNGWGLLFTGVIGLTTFLYYILTRMFRVRPIFGSLLLVEIVMIVLSFIYSGWLVGVLSYPIGTFIGFRVGRLFISK